MINVENQSERPDCHRGFTRHKSAFVTSLNSHDGGRIIFANLKIFCSWLLKHFTSPSSSHHVYWLRSFHGTDGIRSAVFVVRTSAITDLVPFVIYPKICSNYELLPCCSFLNRILPWTFAIFLDQSFLGPYQLLYSFRSLLGLDGDFNADALSFRLDLRESSSF